jgi:signal transduction histidine kinase
MNQKSNNIEKPFRPIQAKMLFAILTVSTILTSIIVFFNFYSEYNEDISGLDLQLQQIKVSSIKSTVNALWNLDNDSLNIQAEGIAQIKDVVKVTIFDSKDQIIVQKENPNNLYSENIEDLRPYRYRLNYINPGLKGKRYLGTLEILATTKNIKNGLLKRLLVLIIAQFIKTFLLSYLILMIARYYINKNIEQIVKFTSQFDLKSAKNSYLDIKRNTSTRDEIDTLQDAINQMVDRIHYLNEENQKTITEQESKIELQKMIAINSSKMAALGEMAGGIAHEINNPLTIIYAKTRILEKMIEKGIPDKEFFLKSTGTIVKTVNRIGNIVRGLKNISRDASAENAEDVALLSIFTDVVSLCEERFKNSGVKLLVDFTNPMFETHLNCYQIQLSQVFLNLLNNSFDAVVNLADRWVKIEVEKNDSWIIIHIIDSGNGIPTEIQEKIFQPFFTTKEIGKGTGLGLSLVHSIIQYHSGQIYCDNGYKNTCFTVKLPL